ncbi:hypothetical protein QMY55_24810 (plasmid) [Comamonas resistens]|nr:hypothetical protein [Comamonas resistens]WHS68093.1 hypothetical protein QMY55_24810 [Comamonas resistens]
MTQPLDSPERCSWLLVDVNAQKDLPAVLDTSQWVLTDRVSRPTEASDTLLIFKRTAPAR